MTRFFLVRRIIRTVFGSEPIQDSNITDNLVNALINDAIGIAIKQNWKESVTLDGIEYVNDSFIYTYKGLSISKDENFVYSITMPFLPIALGSNSGVVSIRLKNSKGEVSQPCIPLTSSQWEYYFRLRDVPNRTFYKYENKTVYIMSKIGLSAYTGSITMVGSGDTDLASELILPDDYVSIVDAYVSAKLKGTMMVKQDAQNDGVDN